MEAYVLHISGRVQGVGFRWFAQQEALKHDVSGYVRNLPDGCVEVFAQGERVPLLGFCDRLRDGPPASRVASVEEKTVPVDPSLSSFEVRF